MVERKVKPHLIETHSRKCFTFDKIQFVTSLVRSIQMDFANTEADESLTLCSIHIHSLAHHSVADDELHANTSSTSDENNNYNFIVKHSAQRV